MKPVNPIVDSFKESAFSLLTQLALKENAVNLAQGFPDFEGPEWAIDYAKEALSSGKNQYAPSFGVLPLREAVAKNYSEFYSLNYDPKNEVVITNGATEAIFCAVAALVQPGDEAIVFEPVYDSYVAALKMAGAVIKVVTLKAPEFRYDSAAVEALITSKTKLIFVNNPHNPTGRVASREELAALSRVAVKHDLYVVSDEVYEFLVFDTAHYPMATFEGMRHRTITISSVGKTLSFTGWKIGWACGPASLIRGLHNAHQFITFCVAHPLQMAIAKALGHMKNYVPQLQKEYRERRDYLVPALTKLGFEVLQPEGSYFALASVPARTTDLAFSKELIEKHKVAVIPTSIFYLQSNEGSRLVRFCFAKKMATLEEAVRRLNGVQL